MLSPVTRGQKSLIRTAECLEFFKHPFEMRDDAKGPHFYVNPGQDTATGALLPRRDRRAGPGRVPGTTPGLVGLAAGPGPGVRGRRRTEPPGHGLPRAARAFGENTAAASAGLALKSAGWGDATRRKKKEIVALLKGLFVGF